MTANPTQRPRVSVDEYSKCVVDLIDGPLAAESVSVNDGMGRVLARDAHAVAPIPAFRNSAMDGIAARWDDLDGADYPVRLRKVGDVPAGSSAHPVLSRGTYVRIMTGAAVPDTADTVIPIEHLTVTDDDTAIVAEQPKKGRGANVRDAGEDVRSGALVVASGTRLRAAHVAALHGAGVAGVFVRPRPKVAVAATGDELIRPGTPLARGQIYESNAAFLQHWLAEQGADVVACTDFADDAAEFERGMDALAADADLVILTGGVSVGDHDVVRDVLLADGHAELRFVAMQPGKPQVFARWRGATPVLAFPGNPVSTMVSAHVFATAALRALTGCTTPPAYRCVAGGSWRTPAGREQFLPVVATTSADGVLTVLPAHERGSASHAVTSMASATGVARVAADVSEVHPGDVLTYLPLGDGMLA